MNPLKHCRFCRHFAQFDDVAREELHKDGLYFVLNFDGQCDKEKGPVDFDETCNLWEQE